MWKQKRLIRLGRLANSVYGERWFSRKLRHSGNANIVTSYQWPWGVNVRQRSFCGIEKLTSDYRKSENLLKQNSPRADQIIFWVTRTPCTWQFRSRDGSYSPCCPDWESRGDVITLSGVRITVVILSRLYLSTLLLLWWERSLGASFLNNQKLSFTDKNYLAIDSIQNYKVWALPRYNIQDYTEIKAIFTMHNLSAVN